MPEKNIFIDIPEGARAARDIETVINSTSDSNITLNVEGLSMTVGHDYRIIAEPRLTDVA